MPPAATAKPPVQRKRNRKRKRRAASSSGSSSSSSSDSSDDEAPQPAPKPINVPQPASESSSSSSSDSSSDSESEDEVRKPIVARGRQEAKVAPVAPKPTRRSSPSPSPPPAALPSFLPEKSEKSLEEEQQLKERFRQFWMSSVVDGFKDDLEEIRKEPNLGSSRLALLIDSLASGSDVFTSTSSTNSNNEMDVVLN